MTLILIPAVLSAKECYDYCGGRPAFEELLAAHGDILKPFRRTQRGDTYYRRVTVDAAMAVAESQETLIHRPASPTDTEQSSPQKPVRILRKQGRRFESDHL